MSRWQIHNPDVVKVRPSAIVLDTDDTLYAYAPCHEEATRAVESKTVELLGVSAEVFREAFARARTEVKQRLGPTASSHSRLLYFQRTIELLGLGTQILVALDLEQTYWRRFLARSALFPGVREFLEAVRRNDIATAIITDLTAQIQFRKLVYFDLDNLFDYVVTSEEAGADKPARAPFDLVLEKLKLPPERIWMIGDNAAHDIEGARRMGMVTLQKVHPGVEVGEGERRADVVFSDFSQLFTQLLASGD